MELWIRSQGKEYLQKVEHLRVNENRVEMLYNGKMTIGIYSTKERALEVLNEIQVGIIYCGLPFEEMNQALKEKNIRVKANLLFNIRTNTCLYEMPKE